MLGTVVARLAQHCWVLLLPGWHYRCYDCAFLLSRCQPSGLCCYSAYSLAVALKMTGLCRLNGSQFVLMVPCWPAVQEAYEGFKDEVVKALSDLLVEIYGGELNRCAAAILPHERSAHRFAQDWQASLARLPTELKRQLRMALSDRAVFLTQIHDFVRQLLGTVATKV